MTTNAPLLSQLPQAYVQQPYEALPPSAKDWLPGDIRRYGAVLSATDNSSVINLALSVSANGGPAVCIPPGIWNCTSPLTVSQSASMYGMGQSSVLNFTGCDGLNLIAQTAYAGTRYIRDLVIQGSSTTTSSNSGIVCALSTGKVIGIEFSNLTIQNFLRGVYVNGTSGLWNCSFIDCFLYNNYHGYYINGQAVYLTLRGGLTQVGSMTGTGPRYGFFAQNNGSGNLQSLHAHGWAAYGYEYNMSFSNVFYTSIEDCDLSVYNICGVFLSGSQGVFNLRDTWIQAAASVQNNCGIYIADLGTQQWDKINIEGCSLFGNSAAGSCAIYLGNNAGPVTVRNNTIGNQVNTASWAVGIGGVSGTLGSSAMGTGGANNWGAVIENNTIYVLFNPIIIYSGAQDVTVGPNVNQLGAPLTFSTTTTPPRLRYFNGAMRGTATFSAATSVAVTFTQAMPNTDYKILLGGNAAGYVWVVSKLTTGFTIDCSASNSNTTDWFVDY